MDSSRARRGGFAFARADAAPVASAGATPSGDDQARAPQADQPARKSGAARVHVALGVEYDGAAFHGFQRQARGASVQAALEAAASRVAAAPVRVAAAGRTDAGVHATGQVVSFETEAVRPVDAWRRGIGSLTPAAIGVVWARLCRGSFHARFDALWRRYCYLFSDAAEPPVIHRGQVAWVAPPAAPLNAARMHRAAQALLGEHDFSAFRASGCQSRSPRRRVDAIAVRRAGPFVVVDVTANAFLLRMVRNIAGALRAVGSGALPASAIGALLKGRDRGAAPPTAPPQGLYLIGAGYADLPFAPRPPPLLGAAGASERGVPDAIAGCRARSTPGGGRLGDSRPARLRGEGLRG